MTTAKNKKPADGGNTPEFTVSELSGSIKKSLEDRFGYVRVRGEISGFRGPHSSGHSYFSLKDDKAKIDSVVWRGVYSRLKVKPEEGMEVVATGRITTYPGSSKYQIVVEALEPAGIGALMALLEARKKQFAAEGLFEESRKQGLPFLPSVVGVVTSPTGAVIRDMLHGFDERCPTRVIVWPVRVQGETCADEVAAAVRGFNALGADGVVPRPDLLIVARGGGSLEDLWGFNEEAVVRAVAESKIPVISAVGHETDWTLVDFVADSRAPTPTKAAEWAVPKFSELVEKVLGFRERLARATLRIVERGRERFRAQVRGLKAREELFALPRQRFDHIEKRLAGALQLNTQQHMLRYKNLSGRNLRGVVGQKIVTCREAVGQVNLRSKRAFSVYVARARGLLDARGKLLKSLSYHGVLKRGFSVVRDADQAMVRRSEGINEGVPLELEFFDGRLSVRTVKSVDQRKDRLKSRGGRNERSSLRAKEQKSVRRARTKNTDQGSLF